MRNIINIWFVNMNWIMLLDNIYLDYYPYDKSMISYWIWILDMNQYIFWIDFWIDSSSLDWCHELSLEIWICLFDYDYEPMVCQSWVSLCAHRIWTLVGRGSHQPVWTDHPTVQSLMLIAFWFSDKLYLLIFLL